MVYCQRNTYFSKKAIKMKVRFTDNSVRIRVRKSDMEQLRTDGQTATVLHLMPHLSFLLRVGETSQPTAEMTGTSLTITLPKAAAQEWMDSEQVGITHQQTQPDGSKIELLIEKDFPCAHRPHEDKADTFEELS